MGGSNRGCVCDKEQTELESKSLRPRRHKYCDVLSSDGMGQRHQGRYYTVHELPLQYGVSVSSCMCVTVYEAVTVLPCSEVQRGLCVCSSLSLCVCLGMRLCA